MPRRQLNGHERAQIASEIRRRYDGKEPLLFTNLTYKQLKNILKANKAQPVFLSEGPKRKKTDGAD